MAYTVPNDPAAYGTWANKPIQLQFNGFGNVYGIPGACFDPQTNLPLDCNTPSARYVPAFAIPDGTALQLGAEAVLTRALNAELRLAKVTCGSAGLSTGSVNVSLPAGLPHDPTSIADTGYYIGTAPSLTTPPAVIDGVLK
jgi:hypothetical protein